jgi:hypothetical protein
LYQSRPIWYSLFGRLGVPIESLALLHERLRAARRGLRFSLVNLYGSSAAVENVQRGRGLAGGSLEWHRFGEPARRRSVGAWVGVMRVPKLILLRG